MNTNENRKRLLSIIDILTKYSDDEHYINANFIVDKLKNEYSTKDFERKTIYSDIALLQELGYQIESHNGYSLYENPFTISEIKILEDMINAFKPYDDKASALLIDKLYHFTSIHNQNLLKKLKVQTKKKQTKLAYFLETILKAISKEESLIYTSKNKKESEIIPFLLHYTNNTYYLYYQYINKNKLYHVRLDNIVNISPTNTKHLQNMRFDECRKLINQSINAFSGQDVEDIMLEIIDSDTFVSDNILDKFSNAIVNGKNIHIKVSISDVLFAQLTTYRNKLKLVEPQSVVNAYKQFLKDIIELY